MATSDVSAFALERIRAMSAYTPGTQPTEAGWIKLNTNELPYPCSPAVGPAILAEVDRLPFYPNPSSATLRAAIARRHGIDASQVIAGNGSDDLLNLLMRSFSDGEHAACMSFPSYSLYPVLASIQGTQLETIPFEPSLELPVNRLGCSKANILFLTTPNAPTGVGFAPDRLAEVAERFEGIVVFDEAYADFADTNAVGLLRDHRNIVITRTLSKSYGLAGLRVGYALASPEIISILDRVRDSYNVNRLSQAGAVAAIEDAQYLAKVVADVKATRDDFTSNLRERGWFVYPSQANFVFARPQTRSGDHSPQLAKSLFDFLTSRKILVRYFPSSPLTAEYLRISIGTPDQMQQLQETISAWETNA